jgi:hypothetical protein
VNAAQMNGNINLRNVNSVALIVGEQKKEKLVQHVILDYGMETTTA